LRGALSLPGLNAGASRANPGEISNGATPNRVPVLDAAGQPRSPCSSARARKLLKAGRAAVYRREPFTIILK